MKNKTYKTNRPDIPYITIGDKFVTQGGSIIEFYKVDLGADYLFLFRNINDPTHTESYTSSLKFLIDSDGNGIFDIKNRYIPLKDKLNQI
jgi:hypothetical protein